MLLWLVAAIIGILAAIILIYKYIKTPKHDIFGFSMHCKSCGQKLQGLKCPNCAEKKFDWKT